MQHKPLVPWSPSLLISSVDTFILSQLKLQYNFYVALYTNYTAHSQQKPTEQ